MVLIKEIELELTNTNNNAPEAIEETLIKDSVIDLAKTDFSKIDDFEDFTAGAIRKKLDIDPGCSGKPISRKNYCRNNLIGDNFNKSNNFENEEDDSDISSQILTEEDEQLVYESEDKSENESDSLDSEDESYNENDSEEEINDEDVDISNYQNKNEINEKTLNIFSDKTKDVDAEVGKGLSVKNQLNIWEGLLEGRIKLQNSLISANKLYQKEDFVNFKNSLSKEDETVMSNACNSLGNLMKTLLELQEEMLSSCTDYINERNEGSSNSVKIYDTNNDSENESICSSLASGYEEQENDNDEGAHNKTSLNNDRIDSEPNIKKKKLVHDTDHLEEIYNNFKPFRDKVIQMWNDRTRVSSGKIRNSDFSAFDQPTLKQIEQILLDKTRLLRKTQLKRSGYEILGKRQSNEIDDDIKDERIQKEYDPEIYDDDDVYHKLLRDFIERKTSDVTDARKHNRQWFEIQQLRSKMKRKVDTRCTKGRKLRYTVHNKLVNFMAPIPCNTWSEEAETQLFKSLFGKANEIKS